LWISHILLISSAWICIKISSRPNSTPLLHKDACKKSKSRQQYLVFGNRYRRCIQAGKRKSHQFLAVNIFETKSKSLQQKHYLVSQSLWPERKITPRLKKQKVCPNTTGKRSQMQVGIRAFWSWNTHVLLKFPFKISQLFQHICKSGFQRWRVRTCILRLYKAGCLGVIVSDLWTGIGRLQILIFVIIGIKKNLLALCC